MYDYQLGEWYKYHEKAGHSCINGISDKLRPVHSFVCWPIRSFKLWKFKKISFLVKFAYRKVLPFPVKLYKAHYRGMRGLHSEPVAHGIVHAIEYKVFGVPLSAQGTRYKGIVKIKDLSLKAVRQV
jgi:hypothetical protein